ncbi:hypothetical protein CBR_g49330 [Chara braunii]|uniref:Uncharacterized protein n=1 Tax=Chara braunii TaxID=69332 RepID=A0A388M4P5_CHABU|nr:hypothetical protein CBR_g49330 [Chara braunii]|eukprot:GBG89540.1 hypothetical protein CBR_g49330 [Chara braunii]
MMRLEDSNAPNNGAESEPCTAGKMLESEGSVLVVEHKKCTEREKGYETPGKPAVSEDQRERESIVPKSKGEREKELITRVDDDDLSTDAAEEGEIHLGGSQLPHGHVEVKKRESEERLDCPGIEVKVLLSSGCVSTSAGDLDSGGEEGCASKCDLTSSSSRVKNSADGGVEACMPRNGVDPTEGCSGGILLKGISELAASLSPHPSSIAADLSPPSSIPAPPPTATSCESKGMLESSPSSSLNNTSSLTSPLSPQSSTLESAPSSISSSQQQQAPRSAAATLQTPRALRLTRSAQRGGPRMSTRPQPSPLRWFPRVKGESYLERKIRMLQEQEAPKLSLGGLLGGGYMHFTRLQREKKAAAEAAAKASEARKDAMVEVSWCRILEAAGVTSAEADKRADEAEARAKEAVAAAEALGLVVDGPCRSSSGTLLPGVRLKDVIISSMMSAVEVEREVVVALKAVLMKQGLLGAPDLESARSVETQGGGCKEAGREQQGKEQKAISSLLDASKARHVRNAAEEGCTDEVSRLALQFAALPTGGEDRTGSMNVTRELEEGLANLAINEERPLLEIATESRQKKTERACSGRFGMESESFVVDPMRSLACDSVNAMGGTLESNKEGVEKTEGGVLGEFSEGNLKRGGHETQENEAILCALALKEEGVGKAEVQTLRLSSKEDSLETGLHVNEGTLCEKDLSGTKDDGFVVGPSCQEPIGSDGGKGVLEEKRAMVAAGEAVRDSRSLKVEAELDPSMSTAECGDHRVDEEVPVASGLCTGGGEQHEQEVKEGFMNIVGSEGVRPTAQVDEDEEGGEGCGKHTKEAPAASELCLEGGRGQYEGGLKEGSMSKEGSDGAHPASPGGGGNEQEGGDGTVWMTPPVRTKRKGRRHAGRRLYRYRVPKCLLASLDDFYEQCLINFHDVEEGDEVLYVTPGNDKLSIRFSKDGLILADAAPRAAAVESNEKVGDSDAQDDDSEYVYLESFPGEGILAFGEQQEGSTSDGEDEGEEDDEEDDEGGELQMGQDEGLVRVGHDSVPLEMVKLMTLRIAKFNAEQLAAIASVVVTRGVGDIMKILEMGNSPQNDNDGDGLTTNNKKVADENVGSSLGDILVKKVSRLEIEKAEAIAKSVKEGDHHRAKPGANRRSADADTACGGGLGDILVKKMSRLEIEKAEAIAKSAIQGNGHRTKVGASRKDLCGNAHSGGGLESILVKKMSRLEREKAEAAARAAAQAEGQPGSLGRKQEGVGRGKKVECMPSLDSMLTKKHVPRFQAELERAKQTAKCLQQAEAKKEVGKAPFRARTSRQTCEEGSGLGDVLVKHVSKLQKEKNAAAQSRGKMTPPLPRSSTASPLRKKVRTSGGDFDGKGLGDILPKRSGIKAKKEDKTTTEPADPGQHQLGDGVSQECGGGENGSSACIEGPHDTKAAVQQPAEGVLADEESGGRERGSSVCIEDPHDTKPSVQQPVEGVSADEERVCSESPQDAPVEKELESDSKVEHSGQSAGTPSVTGRTVGTKSGRKAFQQSAAMGSLSDILVRRKSRLEMEVEAAALASAKDATRQPVAVRSPRGSAGSRSYRVKSGKAGDDAAAGSGLGDILVKSTSRLEREKLACAAEARKSAESGLGVDRSQNGAVKVGGAGRLARKSLSDSNDYNSKSLDEVLVKRRTRLEEEILAASLARGTRDEKRNQRGSSGRKQVPVDNNLPGLSTYLVKTPTKLEREVEAVRLGYPVDDTHAVQHHGDCSPSENPLMKAPSTPTESCVVDKDSSHLASVNTPAHEEKENSSAEKLVTNSSALQKVDEKEVNVLDRVSGAPSTKVNAKPRLSVGDGQSSVQPPSSATGPRRGRRADSEADVWGGISLDTMKKHKSRLQREQEAWRTAEAQMRGK